MSGKPITISDKPATIRFATDITCRGVLKKGSPPIHRQSREQMWAILDILTTGFSIIVHADGAVELRRE